MGRSTTPVVAAGRREGADGRRGPRLGDRCRHEHAPGDRPSDRAEGRPPACRLAPARDAPGWRALRSLLRLIGREASAAIALFGREINGDKAVGLWVAWASLNEAAVEAHAVE